MPAILLNDRGQPEPPRAVVAGLARMSPDLGVRHYGAYGHTHWGITCRWPEGDERWQHVRAGTCAEADAFDLVGWLPLDCPVDQAAGYVATALRTYPKSEVQRLAERVTAFNDARTDAVLGAAGFDEARNRTELPSATATAVYQNGPSGERPTTARPATAGRTRHRKSA